MARDSAEQGALAIVLEVMDGETRNHEVELAERCEIVRKVAFDHVHSIVSREALPRLLEHRRRPIDHHHFLDRGPVLEHQRGEPAVSAPQVGHAPRRLRPELHQNLLARLPVLQVVDAPEVPSTFVWSCQVPGEGVAGTRRPPQ